MEHKSARAKVGALREKLLTAVIVPNIGAFLFTLGFYHCVFIQPGGCQMGHFAKIVG